MIALYEITSVFMDGAPEVVTTAHCMLCGWEHSGRLLDSVEGTPFARRLETSINTHFRTEHPGVLEASGWLHPLELSRQN